MKKVLLGKRRDKYESDTPGTDLYLGGLKGKMSPFGEDAS